MDNIDQTNENIGSNKNNLEISNNSISFLEEIRKWANFLSILGFIFLGLMVLAMLSMGTFMSFLPNNSGIEEQFPFQALMFVYVIIVGIYFFPIYYLFKFSAKMKSALRNHHTMDLEAAFENLKSHYKFIGIFTIVMLSIYLLAFIFGGLFSLMAF